MNPREFGQRLWRRYLWQGLSWPIFWAACVVFVTAALDVLLRLGLIWRVGVLCALGAGLFWRWRRLYKEQTRPSDDELYFLACEDSNHGQLTAALEELTIKKTRLKPLRLGTWWVAGFLLLLPLFSSEGRLAYQRVLWLQGEWPLRTRLVDVQVPAIVEEGFPVPVQFVTEGTIPRLAMIWIDGQSRPLVGAGGRQWQYDFFHPPGNIEIFVTAGDDRSATYNVEILPAPALVEAAATVRDPAYLGGAKRTLATLDHQVLEGSQVSLKARLRGVESLRFAEQILAPDKEGFVEIETFTVTQDLAVRIEGRAHEELSWREMVRWNFRVVTDQPPRTRFVQPERAVWVLPEATLDLEVHCEDDHGLAEFRLLAGVEEDWRTPTEGLTRDFTRRFSLRPYEVQPGQTLKLHAAARDDTGSWGPEAVLYVHVLDQAAFRARLIEQQQALHRLLEDLLASMTRRVKRHESAQLLDGVAEANALRVDLDRREQLSSAWSRYIDDLRQLEGMGGEIAPNLQDQKWLDDSLDPLLQKLYAAPLQGEIEPQRRAVQRLEEMALRLSRSQDLHMALRVLDEMISRQNKVVEELP